MPIQSTVHHPASGRGDWYRKGKSQRACKEVVQKGNHELLKILWVMVERANPVLSLIQQNHLQNCGIGHIPEGWPICDLSLFLLTKYFLLTV